MLFQGILLKNWRCANNLSQAEAGRQVNITQAYWGQLESGRAEPSVSILYNLAKLTGYTCDELLGNPSLAPLLTAGEQRKAS